MALSRLIIKGRGEEIRPYCLSDTINPLTSDNSRKLEKRNGLFKARQKFQNVSQVACLQSS